MSAERLKDFLREMLLIRRFEEKVEERFRAGELPGFLHVAIGQEAVAVGVCRALEESDVIASTHRAHGHTIAKGTHPNEVMAELYGKVEGCSHGYGGSMHLYDIERGNLGANAVVGGGLPGIVGAGLAFKMRGEPRVAVAFFGDGATNIGTFHESLNLAQLWTVPAVFVCEHNRYAESTPAKQHLPIEDMTKRAEAFGMLAVTVDGISLVLVYRFQGRGESLCVSLDQGTAELRFAGKVVVQAGLGYVQLRCDIGITEPVEATQLHQPFRNIQDAGRCIGAVKMLVALWIPSSVQCHRHILSDWVLTIYLLVGQCIH